MPTIPCRECGEIFRAKTGNSFRCLSCSWVAHEVAHKAARRVGRAVRAGELPRLKCISQACADCGLPATHYDHRNYSDPLAVVPVCHGCNLRRGPAARITKRLVAALNVKCEIVRRDIARFLAHPETLP